MPWPGKIRICPGRRTERAPVTFQAPWPASTSSQYSLTRRQSQMAQEQWTAVDHYINDLFVPPDPDLDSALQACAAAGLPSHQVSPSQGKLLQLLALTQGARTILEIGTLGGYSTIW